MGLVNRVVPGDQVLATAQELATQILGADQTVVRQMKRLYDLTTRTSLHEGLRIEQEFFRAFNSGTSLRDFEQRRQSVLERGRSQATTKR